MSGIFEVDGYEVSVGDDVARRADEDPVYANALRVVVRGVRDYEAAPTREEVNGAAVLSVGLAKLTNMKPQHLSLVSKLEDVIDPANIVVAYPYGKDRSPLAFEDTPANREALDELQAKIAGES